MYWLYRDVTRSGIFHVIHIYSGTVGACFKRDKIRIFGNCAYEQSSRDSSVTTVTRLLAGRSAVRFVAGVKIFSCPLTRPERLFGALASRSPCNGGLSPGGKSAGAFKLTTHLYLLPTLRMSGATHLFPLYAFGVWRQRQNFNFNPEEI